MLPRRREGRNRSPLGLKRPALSASARVGTLSQNGYGASEFFTKQLGRAPDPTSNPKRPENSRGAPPGPEEQPRRSCRIVSPCRSHFGTPLLLRDSCCPRRFLRSPGRSHACPSFAHVMMLCTLLDLCVSSLRRGHANLLCIVPILSDAPREESSYGVVL